MTPSSGRSTGPTPGRTTAIHRSRRAAAVVAFIGVAVALLATVAGFVLADIYRPNASGSAVAELPDPLRRSDQWTDWHRIVGAVLVVTAVACLALVVALVARRKAAGKQRALLIGAAGVAALLSAVTVITRPLVEWDQLAFWSVTVGSERGGYWTAAFGEDVRFVLIGNAEVSQAEYGAVVLAHFGAPAFAAAALLFLGLALVRRRGEDDASAAVSTA